jgi:hypothetical protein
MSSVSTTRPAQLGSGRVPRLVFGSLCLLAALAFLAGAGALLWALGTHRDGSGYLTTATHHYRTSSYALTTESLNVSTISPTWVLADRLRITATSDTPAKPLFIGIARTDDADRYLATVAHDELGNVSFDPFRIDYTRSRGGAPATRPGALAVWEARSIGTGTVTLTWPLRSGRWTAVVMNADASRRVGIDAQLKARFSHLWWLVGALCALGALSLAVGGRLVRRGAVG